MLPYLVIRIAFFRVCPFPEGFLVSLRIAGHDDGFIFWLERDGGQILHSKSPCTLRTKSSCVSQGRVSFAGSIVQASRRFCCSKLPTANCEHGVKKDLKSIFHSDSSLKICFFFSVYYKVKDFFRHPFGFSFRLFARFAGL